MSFIKKIEKVQNEESYYNILVGSYQYPIEIIDKTKTIVIFFDDLSKITSNMNSIKALYEIRKKFQKKIIKIFFKNWGNDFFQNNYFKVDILVTPLKKELYFYVRMDMSKWNRQISIYEYINIFRKNNYSAEKKVKDITILNLEELVKKNTAFLKLKLTYKLDIKEKIINEIQDCIKHMKINFLKIEEEKEKEKVIKYYYKLDKKIKTGIKQYIVYFNEYIEKTKGMIINFEVENYEKGLILKLNKNQDIERIGEYFEEYMNFLKYEKIEDIQPLYEINKNEYEKNKDKILLQNEIRELQYKYQTAQLLLETEKKHSFDYKCMIDKMLNQNNINFHNQLPYSSNIALTLNNTSTNINTNTIGISQQIETLQEDIEKIKEFFKELEMKEKEEELDEIDDEILEVSNAEDLKSKKKMFNKFKRIVNQINDENSTLNETIKAAKKGKECLEKIKPYIPTILTTISNLGEYFK